MPLRKHGVILYWDGASVSLMQDRDRPVFLSEEIQVEKKRRYNYNIYLTGFMGSGKSTIGAVIARIYRMEAIDTDRWIEKREKLSVSMIYEKFGEEYFLEKERELMKRIERRKGLVVSTGGETLFNPGNPEIMKKGRIVLIKTPVQEVLKRVKRRHTRPQLEGKSDEEIISMIKEREMIYEKAADIVIETGGRTQEEIAYEIMEQMV